MAAILVASGMMCGVAWAGPCSDDIAAIGKQLSDQPQLGGAPTTGTLTGSVPVQHADAASAGSTADKAGTTASGNQRMGGTAGTKELDAASSNVATSPDDVRRQQLGKPTMAQDAAAGKSSMETAPDATRGGTAAGDVGVSRAKAAWQDAVDLNAKDDSACKGAVQRARDAMKAG